MSADAFVVFTPSGRRGRFPHGTDLLAAARALGVDLDSVCGGRGLCGRCQVVLGEGEFAKHGITSTAAHLSPVGETEERCRDRRKIAVERRLGCQARLLGDVVVDVPAEAQVHRQVVRKRAEARQIDIDPVVRLHYVEVAAPELENAASDLARLRQALRAQWRVDDIVADPTMLSALQEALRKDGGRVTLALRTGHRLVSLGSRWQRFVSSRSKADTHGRANDLAESVFKSIQLLALATSP